MMGVGRAPRRALAAIVLVLSGVTGVTNARAAPEALDAEVGSAFMVGDRGSAVHQVMCQLLR